MKFNHEELFNWVIRHRKQVDIEEQALQWFSLMLSGRLTESDFNEFEVWIGTDKERRVAYRRLDRLWVNTGHYANRQEIRCMRDKALNSSV